jgi:hypothetical protein
VTLLPQTTTRGFLTQAEARRELLVKYVLVETVLTELRESLDQFDAAMVAWAEARAVQGRANAINSPGSHATTVIVAGYEALPHNHGRFNARPVAESLLARVA